MQGAPKTLKQNDIFTLEICVSMNYNNFDFTREFVRELIKKPGIISGTPKIKPTNIGIESPSIKSPPKAIIPDIKMPEPIINIPEIKNITPTKPTAMPILRLFLYCFSVSGATA